MSHLHDRIIEISKKHGLSHLGSCLTAVDIIDEIYYGKEDDEPFILSSGHAGLALYVVLEKYYGYDAEALYLKHGVHPNRDLGDKIYCSTGSLGQGITIALGMAMATDKNVHCLISDGEAYEGTIWEVGNVIDRYGIKNLKVYCNYNGWSAYHAVYPNFIKRLEAIIPVKVYETNVEDYNLEGISAHYVKL